MAIPAIVGSLVGSVLSVIFQKVFAGGEEAASSSQPVGPDDFQHQLARQVGSQSGPGAAQATDAAGQGVSISTPEALQRRDRILERMAAAAGVGPTASAAALLGRSVAVNGSPISLERGRPTALAYTVPAGSARVSLRVFDEAGTPVRTLTLGQQGRGVHQVVLDGLDDGGRELPSGAYSYQVVAQDSTGKPLAGASTGGGLVTGMNVENGGLTLTIGGRRVPLHAVVGLTAGMA
jgi:flagellar basal-body rod modification protein FlgD